MRLRKFKIQQSVEENSRIQFECLLFGCVHSPIKSVFELMTNKDFSCEFLPAKFWDFVLCCPLTIQYRNEYKIYKYLYNLTDSRQQTCWNKMHSKLLTVIYSPKGIVQFYLPFETGEEKFEI